MRRSVVLMLAVAGMGQTVSAWRATAQTTREAVGYEGKYVKHPPFKKFAERLPGLIEKGLEKVEQRLGLTPRGKGRIRVEVRDAQAGEEEVIRKFTEPPFQTRWEGEDVVVTLFAEFVVNGRFDAETEVVHELTHAVMRTLMTRDAYKGVPDWVREGLAVWTAEQVEAKAASFIDDQRAKASVEERLPGLESGKESLERYAEYGLAFEMIEKRHGGDAIKTFACMIAEGVPVRKVVEEITKLTWADFLSQARQYARERLEQLAPPTMGAYYEMLEADRARDYRKVLEHSEVILKGGKRTALAAATLYWRGKALRLSGRAADAEKALRDLLSREERASSWIALALYQLGKTRTDGKKYQEAIDPWVRLMRDHPDFDEMDNVVYHLALCRAKTGKKAEARKLLDLFERSFVGSEYAEKAGALRAELK